MDNNQQIEEIVNSMMVAKMVEVEERVETKLRAEMEEKDKQMEEMRKKVEEGEVMTEEMKEKANEMKKQLNRLESRNVELTTKLKEVDQRSLKDLPFILTCAYQDKWTTPGATITYSSLSADYNNSDRPGGGDGDMDITTGKYTSLTAGHYTVTYSGISELSPGERVVFQLMKNGQNAGYDGRWYSQSVSNTDGRTDDQGSRTVVGL